MDLSFWPGAIVMMLVAALTIALVTSGGKAAWFIGVLVLMVYLVFAMTLYLLPRAESARSRAGFPPSMRSGEDVELVRNVGAGAVKGPEGTMVEYAAGSAGKRQSGSGGQCPLRGRA